MPRLPRYEERLSVPARAGGSPIDPRIGAMPGQALQTGLATLTDALSEMAERQRKAEQAVALGKATTGATRELQDLIVGGETDTDYGSLPTRFQAGADAVRDRWAKTLADPETKAGFLGHFEKLTTSGLLEVKRDSLKKLRDDAAATLDEGLSLQVQRAANARNDIERDAALAAGARVTADLRDAGLITAVDAGKRYRRFRGDVDEARARGLITADPDAALTALADAGQFEHIAPERRAVLMDMAAKRSDTLTRQRLAAEEREQRQAEKRQRELGDDYAKELDAAAADGTLDRAAVERRRRYLSPAEYRGFLKLLKPEDGRDDDATIAALQPRLHREDVGEDLTRAFEAGRLKPETYRTMFNQNRAALKDDRPASPYKSGRQFLAVALDPGQISSEPTIRQPLAIAQARALADYDTWTEHNPQATRGQALAKAEELTAAYENVAYQEMRLALPRPRLYAGPKRAVAAADIERARAEILRRLDGGGIGREEAARELSYLDVWERVLARAVKGAAKGAPE